MTVLYNSTRQADPDAERACNATFVSKDELLARADILTLHVPYAPSTHHIIGSPELAMMKPGAILINAARGGVVDDTALVEALTSGRLAGAGLDVFENEPALNPALVTMKNVVLTPHIASSSAATRHAMAMLAARNLVAALTTGKPPNLLNPSRPTQANNLEKDGSIRSANRCRFMGHEIAFNFQVASWDFHCFQIQNQKSKQRFTPWGCGKRPWPSTREI